MKQECTVTGVSRNMTTLCSLATQWLLATLCLLTTLCSLTTMCSLPQDGFVLVGSVAGQRYWSSMLNLQSTITSGVFTPEDQQVRQRKRRIKGGSRGEKKGVNSLEIFEELVGVHKKRKTQSYKPKHWTVCIVFCSRVFIFFSFLNV